MAKAFKSLCHYRIIISRLMTTIQLIFDTYFLTSFRCLTPYRVFFHPVVYRQFYPEFCSLAKSDDLFLAFQKLLCRSKTFLRSGVACCSLPIGQCHQASVPMT